MSLGNTLSQDSKSALENGDSRGFFRTKTST